MKTVEGQEEKSPADGLRLMPAVIALAAMILVLILANFLWLKKSSPALVGIDSWDFHPASMHVYRYFTGGEEVPFETAAARGSYRGPLFHWASLILPLVFGPGHLAFAMTSTGMMALLMVLVFLIGRRLGGPATGLLAAVITATIPIVLMGSRSFNLEISLAVAVAAGAWALAAGGRMTRAAPSMAFGLFLGAGMLVKGVAFLYMLPPLVGLWAMILYRRVRPLPGEKSEKLFRPFALTLAALGIGLAVSLTWYRDGFAGLSRTIFGQVENYWRIYAPFATESGTPFWRQLVFETGPAHLLVCVAGVAAAAVKRPRHFEILLPWALVPTLGFLAGPADFTRFLTASYPAYALLAAWGLLEFRKKRPAWGGAIILALLFFAGMQAARMQAPPRGSYAPVLETPGHVFSWNQRGKVIKALEKYIPRESKATIGVYGESLMVTVPPKVVYYALALAFPQAPIHATQKDLFFGYRFAELCRHWRTIDFLVLVGERQPIPWPGSGGVDPAQPAPPDLARAGKARRCLEDMANSKADFEAEPVIRLQPYGRSHSVAISIYRRQVSIQFTK